ncbi:MAG TPA: hypothetical protein DGT23_06540 [Micromonosporaceae bacterium]|nr:hypothetical protein [Micromonosporaceae bacterium]
MRAFDLLLRIVGGVLAALMGAGSALLEATATPGFWAIPVGAASVGNAFLIWFAQSTVDKPWAWLVPGVPWFATMVALVGPTTEGDLIANSWTGLATFAAGALVFFVAIALRPSPQPGTA